MLFTFNIIICANRMLADFIYVNRKKVIYEIISIVKNG